MDDEEGRAIAEARERQLLYVGCTRARDVLRINYAGEGPAALPKAMANQTISVTKPARKNLRPTRLSPHNSPIAIKTPDKPSKPK